MSGRFWKAAYIVLATVSPMARYAFDDLHDEVTIKRKRWKYAMFHQLKAHLSSYSDTLLLIAKWIWGSLSPSFLARVENTPSLRSLQRFNISYIYKKSYQMWVVEYFLEPEAGMLKAGVELVSVDVGKHSICCWSWEVICKWVGIYYLVFSI